MAACAFVVTIALLVPTQALAADPWSGPFEVVRDDDAQVITQGRALARSTTSGGTTYLHATYERVVEGKRDVLYRRGTADGSAWGSPFRLNGSTQHVSAPVVAASGAYVYAIWQRFIDVPDSWTVYFRRNRSHGNPAKWSDRVRLTSMSVKADQLALAAAGDSVYVIYRDRKAKRVVLQTSRDRGSSWSGRTLATWDNVTSHAPVGLRIAASGSTVAIQWYNHGLRVRMSTNGARTFARSKLVSTDLTATPRAELTTLGTRAAVAWVDTSNAVRVRLWSAGTWLPTRTVPESVGSGTGRHTGAFPALRRTGDLAVLVKRDIDGQTWRNLYWHTSPDNGVTWASDELLPGRASGGTSLVWRSTGTAYVMYRGLTYQTIELVRR